MSITDLAFALPTTRERAHNRSYKSHRSSTESTHQYLSKTLTIYPPPTLSILPLAKFTLYPYSPSFLLTNSPFYFFLPPLHPSHPRSPYPRPCHPPAMRTCHNPKHLPDRLIVVIHNTCRDQPPRPSHPSASHPPNAVISKHLCQLHLLSVVRRSVPERW